MIHGASTRGRLLVATPPLSDGTFDRSVVLMLDHSPEGALGLVVNRPTEESSAPGLRAWLDVAAEPAVVFAGGPVETDTFIGLAALRADPAASSSDHWAPLGTGLATVDLDADPLELDAVVDAVRIFRGYAGWGAGQLDDELADGAWMVLDSTGSDPFSPDPGGLWRTVLRRQGGRLAWLANCPDDITTN